MFVMFWLRIIIKYSKLRSRAFHEAPPSRKPFRLDCFVADAFSGRQTGMSLADTSRVALDGAPPNPVSVSLASDTSDNASYGLGDFLRLAVTFDKNVTVAGGSPVLVLDCTRMREAYFEGGNGSTNLYFTYEV